MDRRFRANTPAVASEIIDGEAVIMNLKSGAYFSTRGTGGLMWGWLEQGIPESAIREALERMPGASPELVSEAFDSFLADLESHDLVRPLPGPAQYPPSPLDLGLFGDRSFTPPVLEVYDDMKDLLLLDPIHDVDEQMGWPSPRPESPAA